MLTVFSQEKNDPEAIRIYHRHYYNKSPFVHRRNNNNNIVSRRSPKDNNNVKKIEEEYFLRPTTTGRESKPQCSQTVLV